MIDLIERHFEEVYRRERERGALERGQAVYSYATGSPTAYVVMPNMSTSSGVKAKPWWWRYDPVLLVLLILFVAFEVVAHFHFHNANGWMTLSNRIVAFEQHYGWPARVLVYAALVALAVHLYGGVF